MNIKFKIMRKLAFVLFVFLTMSMSAQNNDVIKFMGIPIDGPKSEMISKLEAKGFIVPVEVLELERLEKELEDSGGDVPGGKIRENDAIFYMNGYFNGLKVALSINSYHGKVYGVIALFTGKYDELNAKIEFNNLVERLSKKYEPALDKESYIIDLHSDLSQPFNTNHVVIFTYGKVETNNIGLVSLEMSHPRYKEYYLAIRYYNGRNMPDGDDL